jgi:hypothetical protein
MAHLPAYQPMIAQAGPVPSDDRWAVEMKWDGIRALLYVEDGRVRIQSRGAQLSQVCSHLDDLLLKQEGLGRRRRCGVQSSCWPGPPVDSLQATECPLTSWQPEYRPRARR